MKDSYNFEIVKPAQTIRHNGHDLILAKGVRGAELWIEWTSTGLDHKVYNKDFKLIANVNGDYLYKD